MNLTLHEIKRKIYDKCALVLSDFETESESKDYEACTFKLNELHIICRTAKITPKKVGQFVTFWKRSANGPIAPFNETDQIDFYLVNLRNNNRVGQFVFPKSMLIKKGIISTNNKEGKRAFRVYPPWDETTSKQAKRAQHWQLAYFYELPFQKDLNAIIELYTPR